MAFYVDLNNSFALPPGAKFAEGAGKNLVEGGGVRQRQKHSCVHGL